MTKKSALTLLSALANEQRMVMGGQPEHLGNMVDLAARAAHTLGLERPVRINRWAQFYAWAKKQVASYYEKTGETPPVKPMGSKERRRLAKAAAKMEHDLHEEVDGLVESS